MANKKSSDDATWKTILSFGDAGEALPGNLEQEQGLVDPDLEEIKAMSPEELDAELVRGGFDLAKLDAQAEVMKQMFLDRAAASWAEAARAAVAEMRAAIAGAPARIKRTRAELMAKLGDLRADPAFSAGMVAAFRKRPEGEASDEELAELVEDLEALKQLSDAKKR